MKISKKWLSEKVHIYYFVIFFFIGLVLGIVASLYTIEAIFKDNIFLAIGLGLLIMGIFKFRRVFLLVILVSGFCIGIWRSSAYEFSKNSFSPYIGKTVTLKGKVVDDISHGKSGEVRFKLDKVSIGNTLLNGEVRVSTRDDAKIQRSDIVEINTGINKGFGSFFASASNADVVEITKESQQDLGLRVRDNFANATVGNIEEPQRSLGLGFLLGQKNDLPEDLQNQIKLLGLSHIVVASGYNLTILVAFARKIFAKISKYLSALVAGGMIAGFIMVTGFSPSMSRAGLVAGLSLLAWYYGRKIHPGVLLLVAGGITLMIKPSYIWGDLGWYLSFLAFVGVLILAPLIHDYFWGKDKKPSWLRELLVATLSAQLMTLPILLYSFGTFSFYSLIANALVLPAIPMAMGAVFLSGLAGLFLPFLAGVLSIPAIWLLNYCTFVIDKISVFPGVAGEMDISFATLVISYIGITATLIMLKFKTKHNFLKDKMIID